MAHALALIALIWMQAQTNLGLVLAITGFLSCLFVICMFCHGQLAAMKPKADNPTKFYVSLALGGALGGLFVGLLAPVLFADFLELHIAIAACLILLLRFIWLWFEAVPACLWACSARSSKARRKRR